MTFEIFTDDSISAKSLLKETNRLLGEKGKKFPKYNTVFYKQGGNYVVSVFDKRIRLSLVSVMVSDDDLSEIEHYLSRLLDGKTVFITQGNRFRETFTSLNNINIVEV